MRTYIYIDGFNLYYGAIKGTGFHWLNIGTMCSLLLPDHHIDALKYFTARVGARPDDPDEPTRQQMYLRALGTLPNLEIIFGHFLSHNKVMPLAKPIDALIPQPKCVKVVKTEEKGSDVNLATHLLHDAHLNRFDTAVVVSNDSDLLEPIRLVRKDLRKRVGLLNPQAHPSKVLHKEADFFKQIRSGVLAASQFADQLKDKKGIFHKPERWCSSEKT